MNLHSQRTVTERSNRRISPAATAIATAALASVRPSACATSISLPGRTADLRRGRNLPASVVTCASVGAAFGFKLALQTPFPSNDKELAAISNRISSLEKLDLFGMIFRIQGIQSNAGWAVETISSI